MSEHGVRSQRFIERLKYLIGGLFAVSIVQSFIWLALFSTPIFRSLVFFYRGIFLLGFSFLFTVLTLVSIRRFLSLKAKSIYDQFFSFENCFSSLIFCSSLCLSFFVIVPVTIERSVTTFMLGRMEKSGPMTKDQIRNLLAVDYMTDTNAVERRTSEQTISGNLKDNLNGTFEITDNAKLFLRFSEFIAEIFSVQPSYKIQSLRNESK